MSTWFECECGGAHECLDGETLERATKRAHDEATDEHDHCEGCGVRLAKLPEDATPEEMLCDSCLAKKGA